MYNFAQSFKGLSLWAPTSEATVLPRASPKKPAVQPPAAYGEGLLDYQEYLEVPRLLQLQKPQSKPAHHDEMLFIIIHQAYELWFKLLIHEMEQAIQHLNRDRVDAAHHSVKRVVEVTKLLTQQIHLLETMKPIDFLGFRDHLKPASGFQSLQFRELEFLAGLKEPAYLHFFEKRPAHRRRLEQRLSGPDLGLAYCQMARRLGYKVPAEITSESVRKDENLGRKVAAALVPLYREPQRNLPLYLLTERLIEFDECLNLWRHHHVNVVERIIGSKIGTGGSSGVPYLKTTTSKRCFPYLWEIRTQLELR